MRKPFQHYLNGMRLRAFLRRIGMNRDTALRIAMAYQALVYPIIYQTNHN